VRCGRHPPDHVAHIVGDEQRAATVDRHADRTASHFAILGHDIAVIVKDELTFIDRIRRDKYASMAMS
jgi:hypothetical protein